MHRQTVSTNLRKTHTVSISLGRRRLCPPIYANADCVHIFMQTQTVSSNWCRRRLCPPTYADTDCVHQLLQTQTVHQLCTRRLGPPSYAYTDWIHQQSSRDFGCLFFTLRSWRMYVWVIWSVNAVKFASLAQTMNVRPLRCRPLAKSETVAHHCATTQG